MAYSLEQREQALALCAIGKKQAEVAVELGVSKQIVSYWCKLAKSETDEFKTAREVMVGDIVHRAWGVAEKSMKLLDGHVSQGKLAKQTIDKIVLAAVQSGTMEENEVRSLQKALMEYNNLSVKDVVAVFSTAQASAVNMQRMVNGEADTAVQICFGEDADAFAV